MKSVWGMVLVPYPLPLSLAAEFDFTIVHQGIGAWNVIHESPPSSFLFPNKSDPLRMLHAKCDIDPTV